MVGLHSDFLHACQPFGKVADCGKMNLVVVDSRHERTAQEDALRNSIEHFAGCVADGKPSLADGVQGIKVIRILDRAKEALVASER